MSYFVHTKTDLALARREVADLFAALADDTARKLDDDTTDRQALMEDLLLRVAELANEVGGVSPIVTEESYPALAGNMVGSAHLAILPPYGEANATAIREAWEAQTFNGVRRHAFEGSHSGRVCGAMVLRRGYGEDCGLPPTHVVHETDFESRSNRDA